MTKEDFKYYRHFTFRELLEILKNSNTENDLKIFEEYLNKFKKTISLSNLWRLGVFLKDKVKEY